MGKIYNFIFNQGILIPFNKYKLIKILCFAKRQSLFFLQISRKPPWPPDNVAAMPTLQPCPQITSPHTFPLCGEGSASCKWAYKYCLGAIRLSFPFQTQVLVLNSQS